MMMVTVVMITYNHEKYIREAILSVLEQETSFEFELLVSNDASIDNTDFIIRDILRTHPLSYRIRYFNQERNLGMMSNSLFALKNSRSKYIAFCEGDDFWTDKKKLQVQIEFLEANPEYVMCFHDVLVTTNGQVEYYVYPVPKTDTLYLKDIIRDHYIPTCSLVFRNNILISYPDWLYNSISGDIPLEILLSAYGKTKYLNKKMACYRRNPGGISQSKEQIRNMRVGYIFMYSKLLNELGLIKGYYLIFKLARLIAGGIKNNILKHYFARK